MTTQTLPALDPIPDDIDIHIQRLLHAPRDPAIGDWLLELIKNSGHLSNADDMRWRVLCITWLAFEYDPDQAWPYLMWLNMNEPAISAHLSEILIEAIDRLEAHVQMAKWRANADDERLITFFKEFQIIPARRKTLPLITKLMRNPTRPEIGVWLQAFCKDTAQNNNDHLRPWRLLTTAWYAAAFNPAEGLKYLQTLANGNKTLSPNDNELLMEAAAEANAQAALTQLIADCSHPAVKQMLKEFGHPDLSSVATTVLESAPNYAQLDDPIEQAQRDAETFNHNLACLKEAGLAATETTILDLACGLLAPQTVLFNSMGYKTVGVDRHIPPGYLPISGIKQWFKRRQHANAWKTATEAYYQALARQVDIKLKWRKVKIELADLTRLEAADHSFEVVICTNYLQHAPDVKGLLAEAARVLKAGGLFLADIWPYAGLNGAFQVNPSSPWGHLREAETFPTSPIPLNKWREAQFKAALEEYFTVDQWLPETDNAARAQLTPHLKRELTDYSEVELTRKQIMVVAVKK